MWVKSEWAKAYKARPEVKAREAKLRATPENKAKRVKYERSPERKSAIRKYRASENGKRVRLLNSAQHSAKANNLDFDITLSDIEIPIRCPVLGIALDCKAKRPAANMPSLDRIDNSKGYVRGNVWVISWRANQLKRDATLEELKALVTALEALRACP